MLSGVIGEDPGEHWVLVQIVERSTGNCVEEHQVVEVRDLPLKDFASVDEVIEIDDETKESREYYPLRTEQHEALSDIFVR